MSETAPSVGEIERALMDMAGRHYMNVFGNVRDGDFDEAMFEFGAAYGLEQFHRMLAHYDETGDWHGDSPNENYIKFVEVVNETQANLDDETENSPKTGVY